MIHCATYIYTYISFSGGILGEAVSNLLYLVWGFIKKFLLFKDSAPHFVCLLSLFYR